MSKKIKKGAYISTTVVNEKIEIKHQILDDLFENNEGESLSNGNSCNSYSHLGK